MALKIPLLKSVELSHNINNDVSLNSVIKHHEKLLNNKLSTNSNTLEIIDILGGMDIFLKNYLKINHINQLNTHKLNQINDILLSITNEKNPSKQNPVLYVSSNDTWFHSICKESTATKILQILYSHITIGIAAIFFILLITSWVLRKLIIDKTSWLWIVSGCFFWMIYIVIDIYVLFLILSTNKTITKKILITYEFWFKLYYITDN